MYFGKRLDELTVAEAALLAGSPPGTERQRSLQACRQGEGGREAERQEAEDEELVIRACGADARPTCADPEPIVRRDFILRRLLEGNGRWTSLTQEQYRAALNEEIVLKRPRAVQFKAPHCVWALRPELHAILATREPLARGGYKIYTTLDWKAQKLGEKYVRAGAHIPNLPSGAYFQAIKREKLGKESGWISHLRGANIRNGAMVAQDYRTGDILAYVGARPATTGSGRAKGRSPAGSNRRRTMRAGSPTVSRAPHGSRWSMRLVSIPGP